MDTDRPSVIRGPSFSLPIHSEPMEVSDDDQPKDLSMKKPKSICESVSLPVPLVPVSVPLPSTFSLPSLVLIPSVQTDVVTLEKQRSESPTTPLTPTEIVLENCVPSTSYTVSPSPNPTPLQNLQQPEAQPARRRGRPRLPDTYIPDADQNGDSKIFQKRIYARQYRERIKTQLDAKQDLQRKLNEIRAQNEALQREIDFLKQQNQAYKQQQFIFQAKNFTK
ncbi:hypothetical protein L596_011585 [Steinernema carpocapsae]|uniref:BZIP domain-containing protein n=1 Tax=Steinernema carpocapsae TaxID=34508 RepID=A0A4U5NUD5_STECR|nr:hypothetical protein L596_011585 [Steinernema carpocapsae]